MNGILHYSIKLGMALVVFSASMPAQVSAGQADRGNAVPSVGASLAQPGASISRAHDDSFVIGNDDRLSINVWKEPDLTQAIPVRSDGKISMPLIGEVQASGRTPLQLEQEIATKLRTYITDPDVTVMVMQINSQKFNILGRVTRPGSYPLTSATTVLDAIAGAGGFQDFAKQKSIYILRENHGGADTRIAFNYKDVIRGKHTDQNIRLQPHDTIIVP